MHSPVRSGSSLQSEVLQLFSAGLRLQTVLDLQLCLALLRLQQISALLRLQQSLSDLGWTEGCPGDEPSLMSLGETLAMQKYCHYHIDPLTSLNKVK